MSYDLMVFDADGAPVARNELMRWFDEEAKWEDAHGFNDLSSASSKLSAWFDEMRMEFPPMNGPLASDDVDDPKVTSYGLGRSVIYASFAWSEAKVARERTFELARKYNVGFYDVSTSNGDVWRPTSNGGYELANG
jgi:hypothetical protein